MKDVKDIRQAIEAIELEDIMTVVNVMSVWSNGKKIRRYVGQDKTITRDNSDKGYKKMVAILVEIDE